MDLQAIISKHNQYVNACKKVDELIAIAQGGDHSRSAERDSWTIIKANTRPTIREYAYLEEAGVIAG